MLKEGTDTSQGKPQLISNITACQAVVDAVRTTLGPRGMDKLIVDDRGMKYCLLDCILDLVFMSCSIERAKLWQKLSGCICFVSVLFLFFFIVVLIVKLLLGSLDEEY